MYLQFLVIFILIIANIQSAPISNKSVYQVIQSNSGDPRFKCPSLRKTKLIEPEPEFLKSCTDFDAIKLLGRISDNDVPQALCLLYFNHFERLCYYSNNSTNIDQLISDKLIEEVKTKNVDECETLKNNTDIAEQAQPGINTIMSNLKTHCKRMCTNFDDQYKPICGLSALMINITAKVIVASKNSSQSPAVNEIKTDKGTVSKPQVTETRQDGPNSHSQINEKPQNAGNKDEHQNTENHQSHIVAPPPEKETPNESKPSNLSNNAGKVVEEAPKPPKLENTDTVNEENNLGNSVVDENKDDIFLQYPNVNFQTSTTDLTDVKVEPKPQEPPYKNANTNLEEANKVNDLPKKPNNNQAPNEDKKLPEVSHDKPSNNNAKDVNQVDANQLNVKKPKLKDANDGQVDDIEMVGEPPQGANPEDDDGGEDNLDYSELNAAQPKSSEVKTKIEKSKPLETDEDAVSFAANYQNQNIDDSDSYFFSYFMMVCIMFICGYVAYHNKQKILALLVEGRRGRRPSRTRRPNSANYRKLDSNLEEAVTSSCNKNATQVIY